MSADNIAQATEAQKRWSSMAELLDDANILRHIEVDWRGRRFGLYYKELPAKDVPASMLVSGTTDGTSDEAKMVERFGNLVFRMLARANDENKKAGFEMTQDVWDNMPFMLRYVIIMAINTNSQGGQESFLPSQSPTPS